MIGYITWTEGKAPRGVEETAILRMCFCRVSLLRKPGTPAAMLRRRAAAGARKLEKLGIQRAVFPVGFPYEAAFAKRGVLPVAVTPLYRAMAGEWLRAELAARGLTATATVAVCGDRLTGELVRTVTELCLRYRYVLLDIPSGGEELARQLRREYGVSLLLRPAAEQLAAAEGAVLFAPGKGLECPVVLPLYDGAPPPENMRLLLPPQLEGKLPDGMRRDQLLAAMVGAGMLRPAQIELQVAAKRPTVETR